MADEPGKGGFAGAAAIVVLGCRVRPSGRPTGALARRAAAAARAFTAGVAPIVVASGGRRWGGWPEARVVADDLERLGVPRHAIVEEMWSMTTHENAVCVRGLVGSGARVAVVTCAWHLPRALNDFRAAGLDPSPVPAEIAVAGRLRRVARQVHEACCTRLDAVAIARSGLASSIVEHAGHG